MNRAAIALFCACVLACSESAPTTLDAGASDGGHDTVCGPTLTPHGSACVLELDNCPQDHVPVPGGGCKRVGVAECKVDGRTGIEGPPDWTCKPIGPPKPCLAGWTEVEGGWCEPILPTGPCTGTTMEVIGQKQCQPVGTCGAGTYGNIVTSKDTVFVDKTYAGNDADGTRGRPFPTIAAALASAPTSGQIAVAAGTYFETLSISRSVVLQGRCAELVKIEGSSSAMAKHAAVTVVGSDTRAEVFGITIRGGKVGIRVTSGELQLDRVVVRGCTERGVYIAGRNPRLIARQCLFVDNTKRAIHIVEGTATIERSTIRDNDKLTRNLLNDGAIRVEGTGRASSAQATLNLRESVVIDNTTGLVTRGSTSIVERSVISRSGVMGLWAGSWNGVGATLVVSRCFVARNRHTALFGSYGTKLVVDGTVVKDTLPDASGFYGKGIVAQAAELGVPPQIAMGGGPTLSVTRSVVVGSHTAGILSNNSRTTIDATLVLDTKVGKIDELRSAELGYGEAMLALGTGQRPSTAQVRDCVFAANEGGGLLAGGTHVDVERTVLRDSRPPSCADPSCVQPLDPYRARGQGLAAAAYEREGVLLPCELTMRDSLVANNHHDGLSVIGCRASVERSSVRGTRKHPDSGEIVEGRGISAYPLVSAADAERFVVEASTLHLTECRVSDNSGVGLLVAASSATLQGSTIDSTRPSRGSPSLGYGVAAMRFAGRSSSLTASDSLVEGNVGAGVSVHGSDAELRRCTIRQTEKTPNGQWGDGISLGTWEWVLKPGSSPLEPVLSPPVESDRSSSLDMTDCLVDRSERIGLLFDNSGGSVQRSVFRGGQFSIVLERGADVEIGKDNVYEEHEYEDEPRFEMGVEPSLPPAISIPQLPL